MSKWLIRAAAALAACAFMCAPALSIARTSAQDGEDTPAARAARPRLPQEAAIAASPLPYRAEEVTFTNPAAAGVRLAGTLTLPKGPGPFPAVVLINGSGATGRDEPNAGHRHFLVLADHLTRQGLAVLRYDKRGVGASPGDVGAATLEDLASDAAGAVAYLRSPTSTPAASA
jgi:predicted acyl esterase